MSIQYQNLNEQTISKKRFDLEERTAIFGERIIEFTQRFPKTVITIPLINQLIKAGTSIGANYCEADGAESKRDFIHKIAICKKESKETKYWLRIITKALPEFTEETKVLWQEAHELTLIFSAIMRK